MPHRHATRLLEAASRIILGKERELRLALTCLVARGHLLIEDIPGVGKTTLAHVLARLIGLQFQRIQFTAGTATWKIQGKYLVQTMTDIKIVNISHPEVDEIFNLQEMFPTNVSESSEILKLTATELVLDSESGTGLYTCSKASKPKA